MSNNMSEKNQIARWVEGYVSNVDFESGVQVPNVRSADLFAIFNSADVAERIMQAGITIDQLQDLDNPGRGEFQNRIDRIIFEGIPNDQ